MNQAKTGANVFGLKVVSEYVLNVLKSKKIITIDELYNQVNTAISQIPSNQGVSLDALKRRIYDVINIFHAAKIVDKQDKLIIFHETKNSSLRSDENQQLKIQFKEQILLDKLFILNLFKSIVVRNFQTDEPEHKIPLPAIIVGTQDINEIETNISKDQTEIDFQAPEVLSVLPPDEILKDLNIDLDLYLEFLKSSKEFEPYTSFLFDRLKNQDLIDDETTK